MHREKGAELHLIVQFDRTIFETLTRMTGTSNLTLSSTVKCPVQDAGTEMCPKLQAENQQMLGPCHSVNGGLTEPSGRFLTVAFEPLDGKAEIAFVPTTTGNAFDSTPATITTT